MKIATFSSIWGTSTGGIDVFNRDLVKAFSSKRIDAQICACLQFRSKGLEADTSELGFLSVTPDDAILKNPGSENIGEWTEVQARAVTYRMLLAKKFRPDYVFLHDIFCKEILPIIRELIPEARIITFIHSAYGRSEKRKDKPDSELERKARFQAEMILESNLSLAVGSFSEVYLKSLTSTDEVQIDHIVPGLPKISSIAKKATFFNAMSFGRLDPVSDSIKQIRLSAKAWNQARESGSVGKLTTSDVHFYAVGARGTESVLKDEKNKIANTWKAGIYELPFEEVIDFDTSKLRLQMEKCAFVLLNSWYENFGLTYLESCTFGTPTIISESSGFYHELQRLIGAEAVRRLTISVQIDGLSEDQVTENLKIALIANSHNYDEVFDNAQELSALIRNEWPTWENVAAGLVEKLHKLVPTRAEESADADFNSSIENPEMETGAPWSETIDDLSKWCWQKNVAYHQRLLTESDIRFSLKFPLTPLQKSFWDDREQLLAHRFKDIVISGGTSSGKTALAEHLFGLSRPHEFARARILYIAPTKALAQERAKAWSKLYPSPNPKNPDYEPVIVSTGDDNASDGALVRGEFIIASTVYEKANVILSASQDLFSKINMVIIDEFHMIEDLHRGSILECLLAKIRMEKARRIEGVDKDNHLRMVVITTEKPGDALEQFLTFNDYDLAEDIHPLVITDTSRAKPVTHYCIVPGRASLKSAIFEIKTFEREKPLTITSRESQTICSEFGLFRSSLTQIPENQGYDAKRIRREYYKEFIDNWMRDNTTGKRLLVFMSSKYEILEVARFIKNYIRKQFSHDVEKGIVISPNDEGIKIAIDAIAEVEPTDFNQDLMKCAEEGLFIHNSDVAPKVRATFEEYLGTELPNDSRSEIVIATETLSFGVNLKVTDVALFNVLFPEGERIQTGKPASILISRCDFANMAGRAGRIGQSELPRNAAVYWYLDPEEDKSFESVLESFYVNPPHIHSQLFYRSDARVLANLTKLERQAKILIDESIKDTSSSSEIAVVQNNAVEEFSYPFSRSVLDGLRFLGGTESAVGFLNKIGCSAENVITNFFFETLYYSENCAPLVADQETLDNGRRAKKERELISAVRQVIFSASDPSYNLIRKPATGGYLITPLGSSTIDTGTEIATVTRLRQSLLALNFFWTQASDTHLPFELAILPVFFQPEVHRQYIGRLPEFRHAMEWSAAENRNDLISRAALILANTGVIGIQNSISVQGILNSFMEWSVKNQRVQSEPGRYEEAPQDSCLRLFVAFLAWISGASLRDVIAEVQKIYPSSGQSTAASVFNFESFAENLTWKVLFLVSLIRASKEEILPASSTFNAVRFVLRSRFGSTEKAIPLLFKNKASSPPLNRVQAHSLLDAGFSSAEIALGGLSGKSNIGSSAERKIREHVRHFIRESFQEVSRQFSYLASGTGLRKANEDISKEYWVFALRQVISLLSTAKPHEGIWSPSHKGDEGEIPSLIDSEDTERQVLISKTAQGIELNIYSPKFENDDSDRIRVRKISQFSAYFSFGEHLDIDISQEKRDEKVMIVDFPWAAGATSTSNEFCRLSPAAFGIFLSLCARDFVVDVDNYISAVVSGTKDSPVGARELYTLSERHLKRGSFPESLFEAWAKYIEVGEFSNE